MISTDMVPGVMVIELASNGPGKIRFQLCPDFNNARFNRHGRMKNPVGHVDVCFKACPEKNKEINE